MTDPEGKKEPGQAPNHRVEGARDEGSRLKTEAQIVLPDKLRMSLLRQLATFAARVAPNKVGNRLGAILKATLHESRPAAYAAYRVFNQRYPEAAKEFHEELIGRALDFGYLSWPKRIQQYVEDSDVLDIGCGTGIHGIGYVVVGAKSYTGVDPKIKLDSDRTKNVRKRTREPFGWTPRQVCQQFSRIELIPGTFEDLDSDRDFDVAVMHNVTEHLFNIGPVLHDAARRLRPGGSLIFNHHNFYCWNGHHVLPRTIDEIRPDDDLQKQVMDWAHIRLDAPADHYIRRGLNKIKLDELRALVERDYDLEIWKEIPSDKRNGGGRLTEEILAKFPELTRRDLSIHNVYCVAKRKP